MGLYLLEGLFVASFLFYYMINFLLGAFQYNHIVALTPVEV
jgi:hypothetical protein